MFHTQDAVARLKPPSLFKINLSGQGWRDSVVCGRTGHDGPQGGVCNSALRGAETETNFGIVGLKNIQVCFTVWISDILTRMNRPIALHTLNFRQIHLWYVNSFNFSEFTATKAFSRIEIRNATLRTVKGDFVPGVL